MLGEARSVAAEADAGTESGDAAVARDRAELDAARQYEALDAFSAGQLGPLRSAELFRVDLTNDDAVRRRLVEVDAELAIARRAVPEAMGDAGVRDAGEELDASLLAAGSASDERVLRLRALELRRQILALPHTAREKLLADEVEAVSAENARRERDATEREAERAEEARLRALSMAQEAQTGVGRQLAERRASLEATRGEQVRLRGQATERARELASAERQRTETAASLTREVASVDPGSTDADALYDRIVATLVELRTDATTLLGEIERGQRVPHPSRADLPETVNAEQAVERARLIELQSTLERDATQIETDEREAAWEALRSIMKTEQRVNDSRIALLEKLSASKRDHVLGFGPEGIAQGRREVSRFRLELTWLRATSAEIARELFSDLRRPAAIVERSLQLLALVGIVWGAIFFRRRHAVWLRTVRIGASRSIRRASVLRLVQRGTNALEAIAPELIALGAVLLVRRVPGVDTRSGPISVLYALLLWFAIYRLVLAIAHRGLVWATGSDTATVGEELGHRILRSVRMVGTTAFLIAVLLAISAAVVGKGYLYALVVRVAWLLGGIVALFLVRRWRGDIVSAYLGLRPSGALSRLVAKTRDRWVGFFVAIAAFGFLLASGIARALRRFVLGFEQSRKALAYLFRRRLEKQVEHASSSREPLPDPVLAYFTEEPVADEELRVDRYPGLDEFEERCRRWRTGQRVGPMLVVGRTGYGKSSWLIAARSSAPDCDVRAVVLRERATTVEDVLRIFGDAFDARGVKDVDALARRIGEAGRSIVTVDDAHLLFLRGVGRLDGWRAFERLIETTSSSVLWIVSFAHYPWEFLSWVLRGNHVFRSIVRISPWSEAEITKLLERRTIASSISVAYDDLLVENLGPDATTALLTTARDYNRLIWDFAEGSPRVALNVWGASLVPDGARRARVRLFANPDASILESLSDSARFVLAAVVWHERLSLDEAPAVSLLPAAICSDAFDRFLEYGIVERVQGSVRVRPRWWPVVVRYLRRKHLIET